MKLIGIRDAAGEVFVAARLDESPAHAVVFDPVVKFWADPQASIRQNKTDLVEIAQIVQVPPVVPNARVFCVGLNYRDHVAEGSYAETAYPKHPTVFARWPSTLTVNGMTAPIPSGEQGLDWEGEVMACLGKPLTDADPDTARTAIFGYAAFNDLTSRKAQKHTSQWSLGKNGDRSGPLGDLVTADEVGDLREGIELTTRVNGEVVQRGNTRDQIYELGEVLSYISHTTTLQPGDLIATGTPSGVGYARTPAWLLQPGDQVEVCVERVGSVRTQIVGNETRYQETTTLRNA